jgi:hypothetical protein
MKVIIELPIEVKQVGAKTLTAEFIGPELPVLSAEFGDWAYRSMGSDDAAMDKLTDDVYEYTITAVFRHGVKLAVDRAANQLRHPSV